MPFILFTGKGREDVVIEALNNGADFYIQKGGNAAAQFGELPHVIRELHSRSIVERELGRNREELGILYETNMKMASEPGLKGICALIQTAVSRVMDCDSLIVSSFSWDDE